MSAGAQKSPSLPLSLSVNGTRHHLQVDPRRSLLDLLRDDLGLTGSKKGCDHGQCGACTVLLDGRRVNACLILAAMAEGRSITTIEGLGSPEALSPLQAQFLHHDAFQCGYCTPGQILSATGMLEELAAGWPSHVTQDLTSPCQASRAEISERLSGNLCRCGAYSNIVAAVQAEAAADARSEDKA